ncbi:MAG TPA: family 78 glycoside hydrolase catalytic domain [Candidatus Mediterraneibacter cottocaccae]|nr:family 78 glycoside hydrolase catalytic domain [Candidatus Mediterraneibacter cottocaccae]
MLKIYDLKTEYLRNPRGIDAQNPRLMWKLDSDKRGVSQESFRITVRTEGEKEDGEEASAVWDSGIVKSRSQCVCYEGPGLRSRQKLLWRVECTVKDENGQQEDAVSEWAWFEMGLMDRTDWTGKWIEPETEDPHDPAFREARKAAPYLRKTFFVERGLKKARIYQTAHGLYHFWINGNSGTEDCFKPGLTSYYYRIQYQVYDITSMLQEGENVWAVMLGDGWWRGVTGGTVKNNFGPKLHFLGQIELEYEDGRRAVIGTDESFRRSTGGMLASDMQMGDIYDAAKEPDGWKLPGFDDSLWEYVHLADDAGNYGLNAKLIASRSVPVREKEHFSPREFRDTEGRRVLDFGQNIAGYVKMRVRGCAPGQEITLTHGEDIKDGKFSTDNISDTPLPLERFQQVVYRCSGEEEEEYCPLFSIFGFRYVLLEGYEGEIRDGDFTAVAVYSDMEETGEFTCTNPLLNRLVKNARWSQKGNFMDVAVDCPTRERNAWTGDAQIYTKTAAWFMDVYPFYEKWMQDQAVEQYESGKVGITFPSTSSVHDPEQLTYMKEKNPLSALAGPSGNGSIGEDCAGWGDSAAWIPEMIWLCYGERRILENQYETAKRWTDYMLACAKEHNPLYEDQPQYHTRDENGELDADYIYDTKMHYGEWQEPIRKEEKNESLGEIFARWIREGKPLVATAYMCRSAQNVADMAKVLGRTEDAEKYQAAADKIRAVYDRYFISRDGVIEPGHQAAYVRALAFDLVSSEKRPAVVRQLILEIERNDYCLNTGFLSTPFLLPVLVEEGYADLAYRILEQRKSPSWLHAVELGATTILESWDGMDAHRASFNHYSFGAVCDFLFSYTAGIRAEADHPGYRKFTLCPVIGGTLTGASAFYESPCGTIRSEWKLDTERGVWEYDCTVPVNTTADVILPDQRRQTVGSGTWHFTGEAPVAGTTEGRVRGCKRGGKSVFRGIPYGDRCDGEFRFLEPRPAEKREGILDCTGPAPVAMQTQLRLEDIPESFRPMIKESMDIFTGGMDCTGAAGKVSENCLVLNIVTPGTDEALRPVMVYIHGGGYMSGSGNVTAEISDRLIDEEDIVLVTVNHRLNLFGSMYLGHFDRKYASSGLNSQADLVLALKWLQSNIGAFGGDPENITLFGESGGGIKIEHLMAMPEAEGLFSKAIVLSGSVPVGAKTKEEAERETGEEMQRLGISPENWEELLTMDAAVLLEGCAGMELIRENRTPFMPCADGIRLPIEEDQGYHVYECARKVPVIVGASEEEIASDVVKNPAMTWEDVKAGLLRQDFAVHQTLPGVTEENVDDLIRAFRESCGDTKQPWQIYAQMVSMCHFLGDGAYRFAQKRAEMEERVPGTAPVWLYSVGYDTPQPLLGGMRCAWHTAELPLACRAVYYPEQENLSRMIAHAFASFARTGIPRVREEDGGPWEAFTTERKMTMMFDEKSQCKQDPYNKIHEAADAMLHGENGGSRKQNQKQLQSDLICLPIQKMVFEKVHHGAPVNSFEPRNEPGEHIREDGILYVNDVCYGEKYPNSYLDIWYPDADRSAKRPTVIYIHGGGFIFGDKVSGDPMAAGTHGEAGFFAEIARHGYNVISPNYALAPDYRFPVQLEQVDEMLRFLTDNQEKYGLDMEHVFLGGGSAGADLTELYGLLLVNPDYARATGVYPTVRKEQITGLLIDEAALSVRHFEVRMNAMLGCWMGKDEPSEDEKTAEIMDAAKWIGSEYFPSFVISSNREIFFKDSADDLTAVLEKNGTPFEYFYRGQECGILDHGFLQQYAENQYARECFEKMLAFMERRLQDTDAK